jgi:LysM repeat protein
MSSANVCPFLAISTDSSRRHSTAHVTHACFAQRPALQIELDHQSSYCLSATFTTCPAFAAWAAREAAQPIVTAVPLPTDELAAASRGDEDLAASPADDGTIWSTANAATPTQPGDEEGEERARVVPLHHRRSLDDELPKALIRLPRALSSLRSFGAVVVLIGVVLFATPSILKGFGSLLSGIGQDASPSASVTPEASASPTPTPTPAPKVHVVKSGDTLFEISQEYKVSVEVILGANPQVGNPNNLKIGEQLVIPIVLPDIESSPSPAP